MGFDTSQLFYAITIIDPKARNNMELKWNVVDTIMKNMPSENTLEVENARIFMHRFNEVEAERDLDWAIDYWKSAREALPTSNMNKCKSCVYRVECTGSMHQELSSF